MKQFVKTQKITYNLMSFTGFKALLIFSLLTEGPKSFDEIANVIDNHPYLHEKMSTDTIRVYMNSLKRIGCIVKRVKGDDKISRYMITGHPFELKFNSEQLQSAIKVYKSLVQNMDIHDLLYMDNLFEKIGRYIKNEDFIAKIRKISMLNGIDKNLLTELIDCCEKNLQIVISYNSPNSGIKDIELVAEKTDIANGKIYLYGYGFEYNQEGMFPINRIKSIKEIKLTKNDTKSPKEIKVIYEIKTDIIPYEPDENEKVINKTDKKMTIEQTTTNTFLLKQKLLELGPVCTILEPESFKNEFVKTLNDMKAGYYND
ncbi:WYL domain-containing protein [bacterium]|nr:WYL domain-containing protein [bacterium]